MTGSATYADDVDVASRARVQLDRTRELVESMDAASRAVIGALVELWPTSGWLAAGCRSAKAWMVAHTGQSYPEAARLERIARLCALDERLAAAMIDGSFSLGWAHRLARAATDERARFLSDEVVEGFLALAEDPAVDNDGFADAVRYWADLCDQELAPRRVQPHSLTMSPSLFGGGEVHAALAPVAFANFAAAIAAMLADPDPADAPYRRTFTERQADAADDMASFLLAHRGADDDDDLEDELGGDGPPDGPRPWWPAGADDADDTEDRAEEDERRARDVYDGTYPGDTLDEAFDPANEGLDELELLRVKIRKRIRHQRRRNRRRIRPRAGATINAHIDVETLLGTRAAGDFRNLVYRGDGWHLTRAAVDQMLCDSTLVATLFAGRNQVLDANTANERFTTQQRRAIAARDRCCVFPGCTRPPRHCDTHHLNERAAGGLTIVDNGCLLCRFHHRLLHQYGWKLYLDDDGAWTARDPHGTEWKGRRTTHPAAA
ncbi:MAG: HNH endonuclease signature motif containing protein [Acidimicrobiales bacterium]|nr:HNH endonuclease signature motif containing protein [Acidimicrobiales bacterium]